MNKKGLRSDHLFRYETLYKECLPFSLKGKLIFVWEGTRESDRGTNGEKREAEGVRRHRPPRPGRDSESLL